MSSKIKKFLWRLTLAIAILPLIFWVPIRWIFDGKDWDEQAHEIEIFFKSKI